MKINVGDDVTINAIVVETAVTEICIKLKSGKETWIPISDINTIRPVYKTDGI